MQTAKLRLIPITLASSLLCACAGVPTYNLPSPVRAESRADTARAEPRTDTLRRAPRRATETVPETPQPQIGSSVAELALELIGVPYRYGGEDPNGFDCSGLVYYTFRHRGFDVPRTSVDQFRAARKIGLADADAGDLVFFQDQEKLSHVGIYLGDGLFVHAPASGRSVSVASLQAPYYQQHLVAIGRLLPR